MITTELVNPAELTGFVRGLTFPNTNALERFLPSRNRLAIEYAFNRNDRRRRKMAQYRPFDVESPVGERPGVARVSGRIPPISKKMVLGEEETLLIDALRRQGSITPEMRQEVLDDAAMLTQDVLDRIEFARGQVLSTGKVTFTNDLGFETAQIDYGIPAGNFVTTPGAAWSDTANAKPVTDMTGWITGTYMPANANRRPAVALASTTTLRNLQLNAEVKAFIPAANVSGAVMPVLTDTQLQAVLAAQNLPPILAFDEMVKDPTGSDVRVIPEGLVVFLPAPGEDFGETTFGPTVEALNLARAGYLTANTAPGLTAINMITYDPQHTWTKVSGLVVPVLKDANAVMVADVSV
jgi:hypothetical protein